MATTQKTEEKRGVTQHEMEQLLNLAEKLQEESSRNRSQYRLIAWLGMGLILMLIGVLFVSMDMILDRGKILSQAQPGNWIVITSIFALNVFALYSIVRRRLRLDREASRLHHNLNSLFDLIQEAKVQYFHESTLIEKAVMEIRLRALDFGTPSKSDVAKSDQPVFFSRHVVNPSNMVDGL